MGTELLYKGTEFPGKGTELLYTGTELPGKGTELLYTGTALPGKGTELLYRGTALPAKGTELLPGSVENIVLIFSCILYQQSNIQQYFQSAMLFFLIIMHKFKNNYL